MEKLKIGFLSCFLLFCVLENRAQTPLEPGWTLKFSRANWKEKDTVTLYLIARIPNKQGIYATNSPCPDGPMAASFSWDTSADFRPVGKPVSVGEHSKHDEVFDCELKLFHEVALIKQVFWVRNKNAVIKGRLDYQTCTENLCLSLLLNFETLGPKVVKVSGR